MHNMRKRRWAWIGWNEAETTTPHAAYKALPLPNTPTLLWGKNKGRGPCSV